MNVELATDERGSIVVFASLVDQDAAALFCVLRSKPETTSLLRRQGGAKTRFVQGFPRAQRLGHADARLSDGRAQWLFPASADGRRDVDDIAAWYGDTRGDRRITSQGRGIRADVSIIFKPSGLGTVERVDELLAVFGHDLTPEAVAANAENELLSHFWANVNPTLPRHVLSDAEMDESGTLRCSRQAKMALDALVELAALTEPCMTAAWRLPMKIEIHPTRAPQLLPNGFLTPRLLALFGLFARAHTLHGHRLHVHTDGPFAGGPQGQGGFTIDFDLAEIAAHASARDRMGAKRALVAWIKTYGGDPADFDLFEDVA